MCNLVEKGDGKEAKESDGVMKLKSRNITFHSLVSEANSPDLIFLQWNTNI